MLKLLRSLKKMTYYSIKWKRSAEKELKKVDKKYIPELIAGVEELIQNPYPPNSKKLVGYKSFYRLRVGEYKIIYNIIQKEIVIEIVRIGHRKDVYRI